jgi:hypothetical protein
LPPALDAYNQPDEPCLDQERKIMRIARIGVGVGLALCLAWGTALADTVKFTIDLTPDQQGKPGKGTATLSLDTAAKKLTYSIEYTGLSAPPAMAAFMSPPAQQNGTPGTVPIPLPASPTSPISGTMPVTDAQVTGLKSGQWLLLIGTKEAPEIGGEVKPAP